MENFPFLIYDFHLNRRRGMYRLTLFVWLIVGTANLFGAKAYVTDVFGGQVFALVNGVSSLVTVASGTPNFVSPSYVAVSPDGRLAYVNDYGNGSASIYAIDTATDIAIGVINNTSTPYNGTYSVAFSPIEPKAYVGTGGAVYVIDTSTHTATQTVTVATGLPAMGTPFSISFSNDGKFAYATAFSLGVFVIDTATNQATALISQASGVPAFTSAESVAMNPVNPTQAYVGDNAVPGVFIIDNTTKQATGIVSSAVGVPAITSPYDIAFSPNGALSYVAVNTLPGIIAINTATNIATSEITLGSGVPNFSNPLGVSFSPDGSFAYATDVTKQGVYYIDTATGIATELILISGASSSQGVAFIPAPLPPTHLIGTQKKNDFGLTYALYNVLQWIPSHSQVVRYNIYRDGFLIASVTGAEYIDPRVLKKATVYQVRSVDIFGIEGPAVSVTIS